MRQFIISTELEVDIDRIVDTYGTMLFRICLVILCNESDAEDAVQETFIQYISKAPTFNDSEHEKAWLITVATNRCKNMRRYKLLRRHIDIQNLQLTCKNEENEGLLEVLMKLPYKLKAVLLLHYVEGYKVNEIAKMLNISEAAVKKRLQRGREHIKHSYGKENE